MLGVGKRGEREAYGGASIGREALVCVAIRTLRRVTKGDVYRGPGRTEGGGDGDPGRAARGDSSCGVSQQGPEARNGAAVPCRRRGLFIFCCCCG